MSRRSIPSLKYGVCLLERDMRRIGRDGNRAREREGPKWALFSTHFSDLQLMHSVNNVRLLRWHYCSRALICIRQVAPRRDKLRSQDSYPLHAEDDLWLPTVENALSGSVPPRRYRNPAYRPGTRPRRQRSSERAFMIKLPSVPALEPAIFTMSVVVPVAELSFAVIRCYLSGIWDRRSSRQKARRTESMVLKTNIARDITHNNGLVVDP